MNLPKAYTPNEYEPTIYALWESTGSFAPTGVGKPYCIVMPPPNANGNLHIGHAAGNAIQDILVRYHRMQGRDTIYIPGADHAGFETWVVYEKLLEKEKKSRFDFSREQLYSQVWKFVEEQRGNMELQLRALGASADWKHLVFTLDKQVISTAYSTFKRLWDDGLVYRGKRLVNYCTYHQTSFADIEVSYKNEKGKLWNIAYPLFDKVGEIIVATTRPETMLGDTAIAVHPDDKRYQNLIGTKAVLPLTNREIPIIGDKHVDPTYGTGAVKITPAHDPNDYEIGLRHQLDVIQVIGFDGLMQNVPRQYQNLTIEKARERVLADLKIQELLRGESTIEHSVGHCYKCGEAIQPLIKEQWFIKIAPLVSRAKQALEASEITFTPDNKRQVLLNYFDGLKDWNISRQIPWGIPIPAFQSTTDPNDWIFNDQTDEKSIVVNDTTYIRDEDTFDTWFSSGQWPFITTDYLTDGTLKRFYPVDVMETAGDILFAWVARMIMLGLYATDKIPFKHVYLHGLILDEHGQKMSKSKGNVINPMEVVAEYGSDALRFGLVVNRSAAQNQAFSATTVVSARNFCNKLWNISRFIMDNVGDNPLNSPPRPVSLADHWIVRQLNSANDTIAKYLQEYRFAEASDMLYHAIWDDVADWYIEASKTDRNEQLLTWVLETSLKLAHPFLPFVTETIWQAIPWRNSVLMTTRWPEKLACNDIAAAEFHRLQRLVTEVRFVTAELPGNETYRVLYQNDSLIEENTELIRRLAKSKDIIKVDTPHGLRLAASGREAWLDVSEETMYEHRTNLEVRLSEAREDVQQLEARLANKSYLEKAPAHLVEDTRQQLESKKKLVDKLFAQLDVIS